MEAQCEIDNENEKLAIVGIGCRYGNGVDSVKLFWEMLVEGLDCTTPLPPDRFDASYFLSPGEKTAGKIYIQNGGYISQDPYMFDRQFFKMPPDEAAHLDPQVRLLLEVTWEALENAGIPASSLRGTKTGVYMGVTAQEYSSFASSPYHNMNQYSNSGTNSCMVSNRISYEFDLRGPSFSVDTACSSSLYSIFLACEALKQKSCSVALAGGVNLILKPTTTIGFCQAGMLSGDGKCKSFDQSADGYSRSEGAGVVVLKLLSDAQKDEDRIYAVLRGGALSNDGRTPGIANPSYEAQVDLVKTACRNARVHPSEIVYAEAHGTGTRVGDRTEAGALGEVMGRHRGPEHPPLYIGSVKSNLGHTEGAAGVAGIIKVALSLQQRQIPLVVHFKAPNENLDLEALQIHIPKTLTHWPKEDRRNLACCSSFGFGGANANLVLERSQTASNGWMNSTDQKDTLSCLLLSAANQDALKQRMKDWENFLMEDTDNRNKNVFTASLFTAAVRSHHHAHRIGFIVRSREDALDQLQHKLENVTQDAARYVEGTAPATADSKQKVVFVFSGMGTQWWGMARELMHTQPVFASKIKTIDDILRKCGAKWSLVAMLTKETSQEEINQTEISQPCLCAVAIGLVHLWKQRGLVPDAVIGHSVGEVAAAYAAGLLSLEKAIKLIYRRGRELRKTSGSGKMVAVLHRVEDALQLAKNSEHGKLLDVAAVNSPGQVVFSGDSSSVEGFVNDLKSDNVKCVVLKVNNAFHSRQQDAVKKPFLRKVCKFLSIEKVVGRSQTLPMVSTVTGRYLTVEEANSPGYWFQNVRQQVSFMETTQKLAKDGYRVFVEVGPHPSLLPALRDTFTSFQDADGKFITTGSLMRPRDTSQTAPDSENLLMSQMKLYVNGLNVDFRHLFKPVFHRVVSTPHYPWQRERCSNITQTARKDFLFPVEDGAHLLLGELSQTFYLKDSPVKIWRANLDASTVPWVKDHVLQGAVVVPAAAYTETALAAARSLFSNCYPMVLTGLTFDRFMFASNCEGSLETTVEEKTPDEYLFTLRSHEAANKKWIQHCHLTIPLPAAEDNNAQRAPADSIDVDSISNRCIHNLPQEDFYSLAVECGFQLGPTFRGMVAFSFSEDCQESLVFAKAPASVQREFHRYVYHPAFMDSMLQSFAVLLLKTAQMKRDLSGETMRSIYRVPKSISRFILHSEASPNVVIHMRVKHDNQQSSCDIDVADSETKKVFCSVKDLVFETIQAEKIQPQVWNTIWKNLGSLEVTSTQSTAALHKKVVIFSDGTNTSLSLIRLLEEDGVGVTVIGGEREITEKVLEVLSKHQDFDTIFIVMRTSEALNIDLNTNSVMSQNQFEKLQESPLACCAAFNGVRQLTGETQLNLLLVTKGGYYVKEGDDIHPFAAVIPAVWMTLAHEESSLSGSIIDLPIAGDSDDCAKISREIIQRSDSIFREENCIAVRSLTSRETGKQSAREMSCEIFTPRMQLDNIAESPGIVPTIDWSIAAQASPGNRHIFVGHSPSKPKYEHDGESLSIKVEAFTLYSSEKSDVSNSSASFIGVYAGKSVEDSDEVQNRSIFVGLTICQKVSSIMTPKCSEVTEVPGFLNSSEAVSIVKDFLPYAALFSQTLPVSTGMRLCFVVDATDSSILAAERLAGALGAETVLLKGDIDDPDTNHSSATARGLKNVDEASVDVLFLRVRSSTLDRSLKFLLPKLKRNATVVIMEGRQQQNVKCLPVLPPKIKMMMFDSQIQRVNDCLTSVELSHTLLNLWKMFDPNTVGHLSCNIKNFKDLSSLAASNTPIPEEEVIEVRQNEVLLPLSLNQDGFTADKESAYFITGGTSGFGLKLLEWLVARGARYIYIGSRRSMNEEIQNVIQQATKVGANVQHIQIDISNAADVEIALKKMQEGSDTWPTLKYIFHSAAVFSDSFIYNLTTESWNSVMAPKAYGALLLHQMTEKLGIKLDGLIMMSSSVSLIGNAGQASYCSANVFLNALSHYRQKRGLPATAVQAGVISNVGFAEREDLVEFWAKNGVDSMTPNDVLGGIGCALLAKIPQLGISGYFNRKLYAAKHRGLILSHFKEKHGTMSMMKAILHDRDVYLIATENTPRQVILKLPLPKAREKVMELLAEFLSQHLGLTDTVQYDASPISVGLDSLQASEFSQLVNQQFEVNVGAVDFLNDKNTIEKLAKNITNCIFTQAADVRDGSMENDVRVSSSSRAIVVEGDAPASVAVKLVCFPSNGAGPSLYASWIGHLIQYGVQVLMIQLPGWEGRDDEQPLTSMNEITRLIRDELVTKLPGSPFAFFGHSMGSLIAFEVAHLLQTEHNMCPKHLFISSWFAPTASYPHPEELQVSISTFERLKKTLQSDSVMLQKVLREEKVKFSFLDITSLSNIPLMRRLVPCIEAAVAMCKSYSAEQRKPLECGITVLGGKDDTFVSPALLDAWEIQRNREFRFKKVVLPGNHMYILTRSAEVLKEIFAVCKFIFKSKK